MQRVRVVCATPARPNAETLAAGRFEVEPSFAASNAAGKLLDVRFEHSEQLWPWSGYLALYLRVVDAGAAATGTAEGQVSALRRQRPAPERGRETA